MDPDPVWSAFIWGRGSRGIKWGEKQILTNKFLGFFSRNLYFSILNLKRIRTVFGSGPAFIKVCGSGSVYDQCGFTILIWTLAIAAGNQGQGIRFFFGLERARTRSARFCPTLHEVRENLEGFPHSPLLSISTSLR